jgi:ribonuclease I
LTQSAFFTNVMLARAAVQVPVQISSLGAAVTEGPAQIEAQFAAANPSFPTTAFRTACKGKVFSEIRTCFDKSIKGRACTVNVGECGAQTLTILPPG